MRNLDAVAKALVDSRWDYMNESGRGYVREYATAAIDAYRTLTDEQWQQLADIIEHIPDADDALTAIGFRRTDEQQP